jgi:hypothetical protein
MAPSRLGVGFRWLLPSSWLTNLGDGFALAAGPLLVASLTDDAFLVALAATFQWLPPLLFAPIAGALTDHGLERCGHVAHGRHRFHDAMEEAVPSLALELAPGRELQVLNEQAAVVFIVEKNSIPEHVFAAFEGVIDAELQHGARAYSGC